jgi:hypothetical protein
MPTSSASEPLPHGSRSVQVIPQRARLRSVPSPASDEQPRGAPPAAGRRRAIGRGQPLTLLPGGRGPATTTTTRTPEAGRRDQTAHELAAARRAARGHLPPPTEVAEQLAIALFEVEAGCRSAAQLERLCAPELWDRLEGHLRRHGGSLPSGRKLIRVHYQELVPGVADTVAVVERGQRVQPVAMRLDARSGRWLVTELRY